MVVSGAERQPIVELEGEALEVRVTVAREEALRRRFGFELSVGGDRRGIPILLCPENGVLRVGTAEAPFAVAALPEGEDLTLRLFLDRYLVEVFASDRQALVAAQMGWDSVSCPWCLCLWWTAEG
ncbi:MAG: hypothetical protein KatS3mg115_2230 [Candidatus Poribacteria bacterium]|nr:MAG: hypothetical protein KatS3mg115_2230 [Candidatus Poribacteria bacterium]